MIDRANVSLRVTKRFEFRGGNGDTYWPQGIKQPSGRVTATRKLQVLSLAVSDFPRRVPNRGPSRARILVVHLVFTPQRTGKR